MATKSPCTWTYRLKKIDHNGGAKIQFLCDRRESRGKPQNLPREVAIERRCGAKGYNIARTLFAENNVENKKRNKIKFIKNNERHTDKLSTVDRRVHSMTSTLVTLQRYTWKHISRPFGCREERPVCKRKLVSFMQEKVKNDVAPVHLTHASQRIHSVITFLRRSRCFSCLLKQQKVLNAC